MILSRSSLSHPAFLLFFAFAVTVFLLSALQPKITSVHRVVVNKEVSNRYNIWFPHWGRATSKSVEYRIHLRYLPFQNSFLQFVPTGCIESITVNKFELSFPPTRACNEIRGFRMNLARYLNSGENEIVVRLVDQANYGLDVKPNLIASGLFSLMGFLLLALVAQVIMGFDMLLRKTGCERFTRTVFAIAATIIFWQMYQTTYREYVTDMPSHVQYVRFIVAHHIIPEPDQGWQFYHPPLYYSLGALPFGLAVTLQSFSPVSALRFFTVMIFLGMLFFGVLCLRSVLKQTLPYRSSLLLLCFWPSGIMLAARTESNLLYYLLFSACIYYAIKWLESKSVRTLLWMIIAAGLAVGSRSNGLVVMGITAIIFCWALYRRQIVFTLKDRWLIYGALLAVLFGFGINYGRTFYYSESRDMEMDYIVGNIDGLTRDVAIEKNALNFFKFSPSIYFNYPYLNNGNVDEAGRQYFWNFFLKSALYGQFDNWKSPQIAMALSIGLLVLIAYMLAGCILAMRNKLPFKRDILLQGLIICVALSAMGLHRYNYPFAPSQDFRYVYPLVISFAILYGISMQSLQAKSSSVAAKAGELLALIFCLLSVSFFLVQRNNFLYF